MPRSSEAVFQLLHDYSRRLEWDTLLREARLTRGHDQPGKNATSVCVGKPLFGLIGIESRYITFTPGSIAAVEMINKPPFFEEFAASIRHTGVADGSHLTYRFRFTARPRVFRWILNPIMLWALKRETNKRLRALSRYLEGSEQGG